MTLPAHTPTEFKLSELAPNGVTVETIVGVLGAFWSSSEDPEIMALELEFDRDRACLCTDRPLTADELARCREVFASDRYSIYPYPSPEEDRSSGAVYIYEIAAMFRRGIHYPIFCEALTAALDAAIPGVRHTYGLRGAIGSSVKSHGEFRVHAEHAWSSEIKATVETLIAEHAHDVDTPAPLVKLRSLPMAGAVPNGVAVVHDLPPGDRSGLVYSDGQHWRDLDGRVVR